MNTKKLIIIEYMIEIIFIVLLSIIYYLNQRIETPRVIYIPKGSINHIISYLDSRNYNVSKIDSLLLRLLGSPQSGWIDMKSKSGTKADFLYNLTTAKAAMQTITLIPGETTYIFFQQLAKELDLNESKLHLELKRQSKYQEGVFIPDTYQLPIGITEKRLIAILVKKSMLKYEQIAKKIFGKYDERKWFQYIAIASVIQKEAANKQEMSLVSSVIYNRIKKGMKLQMDGTLNYGKYSHIKVTRKRIKKDKSIYNTYKNKGVPKLPVCNVSISAIQAAIFPSKTNYLYFMRNKKGTHDFTRNYSTHLRNIRRATK